SARSGAGDSFHDRVARHRSRKRGTPPVRLDASRLVSVLRFVRMDPAGLRTAGNRRNGALVAGEQPRSRRLNMTAATGWGALAFVLSYILIALTRRFVMARQVLDIPNERSSHVVPTSRGAGLG